MHAFIHQTLMMLAYQILFQLNSEYPKKTLKIAKLVILGSHIGNNEMFNCIENCDAANI